MPMTLDVRAAIAAMLLMSASTADAQSYESVGIRAQGMAGAFVAVADDATATWWNPAGLAAGAYFNGVIEWDHVAEVPAGGTVGIAFAFPALGLSYYRVRISQIEPVGSTVPRTLGREDQGVLS